MMKRRWRCACGHHELVPVQALGETGTCPKCGSAATVTLRNSEPVSIPDAPAAPAKAGGTQANCARCARPFRGDWDIHGREGGALCNICARQVDNEARVAPANGGVPSANAVVQIAPEEITAEDWNNLYGDLADLRQAPDDDARWHGLKRVLTWMLGASILVGGTIAYMVNVAPDSIDAYHERHALGLALLLVQLFVEGLVINVASLYLTCWYLDRLPNNSARANLLSFGIIGLLLAIVSLLGINGFMAFMGLVITFAIIKYIYDFDRWEYISYCCIRFAVGFVFFVGEALIGAYLHQGA